jgi:hypothetical protein
MKSLFLLFFVSDIALSCPACFGKNNADDEEAILKMYKQKSEIYKQKYRTESGQDLKQTECDFSKGNDNCKKVNP